ncbi:hypothetical protein PMSD_27805 [Paenibacillus macquariensis subsp. defensor]|nr:hypothetical protein PMSD_27805 [Paenibacillus macquariensis subsp. defensor]
MEKFKYYYRQYRGQLFALLLTIGGIASDTGSGIFFGVLILCYYGIRFAKMEHYDCIEYEEYEIIEGLEQLENHVIACR